MNLHDLGQLFITGISGLVLTEEEKTFISDNNIGGVILFKQNFQDPGQLAELINSIQVLRDEYPLFIAVDQEGGRVRRFQTHFTQFPSMYEIGKLNSPKFTFEIHKAVAEELKACGVNLNLAPCCDILTNPNNKVIGDRAFSEDAEIVEKNISAAIRGLHTGGVLACAKHFPGHGGTTKDSHFDLPYVKTTMEELKKNELIPFVKASKSRTEFMMMAHLVVDAIDPENPLTLSKKAYKFLRSELKFKKLIISDDMDMKSITDRWPHGRAATNAFIAGVDILEYRSMDSCREAFECVKADLKNQLIDRELMNQKVERVMDCKKQHFSEYKPVYIPELTKYFKKDRYQELLDRFDQL